MTTTAASNCASSPSTSNHSSPIENNLESSKDDEQHQLDDTQQLHQEQLQNQTKPQQQQPQNANNTSEQKRPMNAFLLFCKRQRSLVREKYPNLENRSITKILGDWWSKLDKESKDKYTDLARAHKEAFMKANPDFKWCKTNNNASTTSSTTNSSTTTFTTTTTTITTNQNLNNNNINNSSGSLQQQHHFANHNNSRIDAGPSNNINAVMRQNEAPKPPKKRFLERKCNESSKPVPYISLDQDTLDRVIDEAFSEKSANDHLTNSNSSMSASTSSTYSTCIDSNKNQLADEPVDYTMNRTISTTSQKIINNLVERMLSGPDNVSNNSISTITKPDNR